MAYTHITLYTCSDSLIHTVKSIKFYWNTVIPIHLWVLSRSKSRAEKSKQIVQIPQTTAYLPPVNVTPFRVCVPNTSVSAPYQANSFLARCPAPSTCYWRQMSSNPSLYPDAWQWTSVVHQPAVCFSQLDFPAHPTGRQRILLVSFGSMLQ